MKAGEMINGVRATDMETGKAYEIYSRAVINATGVFTDSVLQMDDPDAEKIIAPSQGIHLVLDKEFLSGITAIMVPQTADGRVLFAVPWHGKVIVGATDTLVPEPALEPRVRQEEIELILSHAAKYLTKVPRRQDVRSVFAGLRPLVNPGYHQPTALISRGPGINLRLSGGKVFSTCSFKDGCFSGILPCDKRRRVSWRENDIREDLTLSQS